jgi:glutaredoxin-related protein
MQVFVKMRQYALSAIDINEKVEELRKLLMLQIDYTEVKFAEQESKNNQIITALNCLADKISDFEKVKEPKKIGFIIDNNK